MLLWLAVSPGYWCWEEKTKLAEAKPFFRRIFRKQLGIWGLVNGPVKISSYCVSRTRFFVCFSIPSTARALSMQWISFSIKENRALKATSIPHTSKCGRKRSKMLSRFWRDSGCVMLSLTSTVFRNHQRGPDHCDGGFLREQFAHKQRGNYPHLEGFRRVLEVP
jgi:hypothetical protein